MTRAFCTKCGSALKEGVSFCNACGAPVDEAEGQRSIGAVEQTRVMPAQRAAGATGDQVGSGASVVPAMEYRAGGGYSAGRRTAEQPASAQGDLQFDIPKSRKGFVIGICVAIVVVVIALVIAFVLLILPSLGGSDNSRNSAAPAVTSPSSSSSSSSSGSSSVAGAPAFTSVTVSSQLPGDADTADYGAVNLTDGNSETAWNEGAESDGTGEWIRFSAATPQHVTSVSIMGGFPALYKDGSDIYPKNARPKQITISYDGGSEQFTMQDLRGQFQTFTLSKPVNTKELTITIDSVYAGSKYSDCCVAEVKIQ